ncbi:MULTISPECIES: hypothetical protein [Lysobacter]|uniref:hypothetical protein n=1 Tax=Lysobacter TaxID=68 RepID=UPI001F35DA8F|nr:MULTISPECIES: hypothetical protein [Lysobacter]UJB20045.1 hypothetical protein L1A79_02830 [Lysobacter capsici]UJQ30840.1 hypothetical protein L2D09_12030 [Lysobacter gummosus]
MLRICLCLLFAFASLAITEVGAREVNKLSPNDACSDSATSRKDTAARSTGRNTAPATARDTKAKPSMHSDSDNTNRLQSPRWHNFLPGMFR